MERLWTKSFVLMIAGTLFLFIAFYSLYPTLPLFIKEIGGNETEVGLAMGVFMLCSVILRPIVGGLLDRFGRRPFIISGLLLFILSMYLYDWVGGIIVLMGLRIIHGMSWALSSTAIQTAVTDMIPPTRRGEGFGWFGMAMTIAMATGPLFGIWVIEALSYHALFLFGVGLSSAALLLTFGAKMPYHPQANIKKISLWEKSILPISVSVFLFFLAYGSITAFVPLFAESIKVNSGMFFLAYAATLALTRPIAGKLSDRFGESSIIIPALISAILALIVLSFSTGLFGVLVSAVLYGIGFGSAHPSFQAATLRLVPSERRGVANASLSTAIDLGIGLGAILLGWVSQQTNYQILFIVSAGSVLFALLQFSFFVKPLLENKVPDHSLSDKNISN